MTDAYSVRSRPATGFGLILFQIDDMTVLERRYGETMATGIAHAVEARLWQALPEGSGCWQAARGRFAVSLPGGDAVTVRSVAAAAQRLVAASPVAALPAGAEATVSVGGAVAAADDLAALGPAAEDALAEAQAQGRGGLALRRARGMGTHALVERARAAVAEDTLNLVLEPVHRAEDTPFPAFEECLARLANQGEAAIGAARFLPALAETDGLVALDRCMLARALSILSIRPRARLSLNIDAATLDDAVWAERLASADPLLAVRLVLEIDAAALAARPAAALAFADAARRAGAALAVDRFGEAALAPDALDALAPDMLKLRWCPGGASAGARRDGLEAARARDLVVVASCLDDEAALAEARVAGVDLVQGRALAIPAEVRLAPARQPLVEAAAGLVRVG